MKTFIVALSALALVLSSATSVRAQEKEKADADAEFLTKVVPGIAASVKIIEYEVTNTSDEKVKEFAERVLDQHKGSVQTATGHAKRLLHASFHRDPRELIEDVVRAQNECMGSWEMDEANRAWDERREARFYPPPSGPRRP